MPFNIPKEFIPHIVELGRHLARTFAEKQGGHNVDGRVSALEQAARGVDDQLARMRDTMDANFRQTRDTFQSVGESFERLRAEVNQQVSQIKADLDASRTDLEAVPARLRTMRLVLVGFAVWNVALTIIVILLLTHR